MSTLIRAAGLLGATVLALGGMPAASHAGQGNDTKSERGAQTHQDGTFTFVDTVPCADDDGDFHITLAFNSVERSADDRGHFTATGSFEALPVTVTDFVLVPHDDHVHRVPTAWESRPGASYTGHFTEGGTMNAGAGATTETFHFQVNGRSSAGERVLAHVNYHRVTVDGTERGVVENEDCR